VDAGPTSRIYYTDPHCRLFQARVVRTLDYQGRPAAVLDKTAFYATSGGQPCDTGRLTPVTFSAAAPVDVLDTVDADDQVTHVLTHALAPGTHVTGEIDWTRRFDHMQQHTGQHVLSAAFDRLFANRTNSFHMGADVSTIDLEREMSEDEINRAEEEANRIVSENREVAIRFVAAEEAARLSLRKEPARTGTLRLIDVSGFDLSACGGTHVARTGAIGSIVVCAVERFRGGTRVTFACGSRAVRAFQALRQAVVGSTRALSVLPHELPAAIDRLQNDGKDLRRSMRKFQEALAAYEAERLAAPLVVAALDGWDAAGLKAIALHITSRPGAAVALFSTTSPIAVVIGRSADVSLDATSVMRALTDHFGGRGGGKSDLAQAGGLTGDMASIIALAHELLAAPGLSLS
jgi:alanyl-tRNA synthetase